MTWGIAQRTAIGCVLLAVVVAAGFGGLIFAIAALERTSDRAQHAEGVIATADRLERLFVDLQSGQRGFAITQNQAFLEPARRAKALIPSEVERLRKLVAADPVQQARVVRLAKAIDAYVSKHSEPLVSATRSDPARARAIVAAGVGKRLADSIREQFSQLTRAEERLLGERRRGAAAAAGRAYWLAGVSAGVVLLLVLGFAWLLRQVIVGPLRALALGARTLGRGDLSARVDVTGEGEVGELGRAFNEMAASLERSQHELHTEQSRIEALYRFAERISAETDVEELAIVALDELCGAAGTELGVLYAGAGDDLWLAAQRGVPEGTLRPFTRPESATLGRLGELQLPLRHGDRVVGVIVVARADGTRIDPESVAVAENLAGQAAVALSNDLAYREARRVAGINQIVLDSTRDGIVMLDPLGRRILVNDAYDRQMGELGVPPHLPYDERLAAFAGATTDPESFTAELKKLLDDPETEAVLEFTASHSGRTFQLFSTPATEAGRFVGRLHVTHEVTAERQADRLKSELLATVSHELRTPLAGILGFAELLQRRELDDKTRFSYVETVHREAVRLTGLINDFLDLQRIEEGVLNLALAPLYLRELVERQMRIHEQESAEHSLEFAAEGEPTEVVADQARIAQVVANLISNAIKYSPGGGVVRVGIEAGPDAVRVSVADEGIGIPPEQQQRIFEKFFRVDSSDNREIGGTGLGLALSREIIEAHGGHIGFESELGRGSTFWFELPAPSSEDTRPRVLVVAPGASPLVEYLEEDGFRVETAESGPEALRRFAAETPALVCLDLALPGPLDGRELLARLKARPEGATTPVVVCAEADGGRRATALGAAEVLQKPFSHEELRRAVRQALARASAGGR